MQNYVFKHMGIGKNESILLKMCQNNLEMSVKMTIFAYCI